MIRRYRNRSLVVLAFLLVLVISCACTGNTDTEIPSKSFLWEVTGDSNQVFILGSVHLADSSIYPLADSIEDAFARSDYMAVEFDIMSVNEGDVAMLLLQKARYPAGETLYHNIPQELYEEADDVLEKMGADILLFNSLEPWAVAMEIEALEMVQLGYTPENGIDMYFLNEAHSRGMEVHELESAEFQIELMDTLPEDIQIFLLENIVSERLNKKELERMFDIWKQGDVGAMEELVFEDADESSEFRTINRIMLDERNFGMVEKIIRFLSDEESYFVVVGAAHLVGDNGLINLLEDAGYEVAQL